MRPEQMPQGPTKPLKKNEALEEANMMRTKLGVDPQFINGTGENAMQQRRTAEEYDEALEVVEELKKMAEEEPTSMVVMNKLSRLATKSGYAVLKTLSFFGSDLANNIRVQGIIEGEEKEALKEFDDAALELKRLKAEAVEFKKNSRNE